MVYLNTHDDSSVSVVAESDKSAFFRVAQSVSEDPSVLHRFFIELDLAIRPHCSILSDEHFVGDGAEFSSIQTRI